MAQQIQQEGSVLARDKLVMANLGLVHFVAKQMLRQHLRYEDLVHEGFLGLMRASKTFDPKRRLRFSTYGVFWIRAKIQQFIQRNEKERQNQIMGLDLDLFEPDEDNPEEIFLQNERMIALQQALIRVVEEARNPQLKILVEHRLLSEAPESLERVGERMQVSRETCRLLEIKLLKRLQERLLLTLRH